MMIENEEEYLSTIQVLPDLKLHLSHMLHRDYDH